jgi:hypothetical protein
VICDFGERHQIWNKSVMVRQSGRIEVVTGIIEIYKRTLFFFRTFSRALVSNIVSSGIWSMIYVRFAKRSPWFLYPKIAGTPALSNSISS